MTLDSDFSLLSEKSIYDLFIEIIKLLENKNKDIRDEHFNYLQNIITNTKLNEWIIPNILEELILLLDIVKKPYEKECSLNLIELIINNYSKQIKNCLIFLIPNVSNLVWDTKLSVKELSRNILNKLLKCNGNKDLDPFLHVVLETFNDPNTTEQAIEKLASCVFVQNVECSAITVIEPILVRGLKDKKYEVMRKSSVIIDNMCKLVENPKEILPFANKIEPMLKYCADTISDPEARSVAERALKTLQNACGENKNSEVKYDDVYSVFKTYLEFTIEKDVEEYLCKIVTNMINNYYFDNEKWNNIFSEILHDYCVDSKENIEKLCNNIFNKLKKNTSMEEEIFEDNEPGKDLYKGSFSLAYGALTLLNNASLHLKRNRFYGLLGPNNCGKTTLMRAIANEQVEGFPKRDELKTVFVEHEIEEREVGEDDSGFPILNIDLCGIDWVVDCCNHVYKMNPPVTREQVEKVMEDIGFGNAKKDVGKDRAADAEMQVTTYSGGWKMKMQLCAATLMNADILMLDEPTGHLDVNNIEWIKNWLKNFMENGGSLIVTSHDSSFLNEMCTHIIDFQKRKLKTFAGNKGNLLKEFVEKFPEKKGYFELKNDVTKFVFPEPGQLEGVKSMTKSILKMTDITFQYPSRDKPTIMNVNLECSRVSRVAVIGANGAGKSTAIKVLNGELKPTSGTITKHPNLRVAYVAQHAFHHLEKHLNKTPTQYILWRFAGNEDKENLSKLEETESDIKISKYCINSQNPSEVKLCSTPEEERKALEPEFINARRENKKLKTRDYQVKWKTKTMDEMIWVTREILIKMGCIVMVQKCDEKEAAAAGLMSKALTASNIEKHLSDFSIEPEQASHTLISSLSGGQKVKVVLAASLWLNPHLIILDEPTNYLDRDGLGALTKAIDDYKGGVIIISHNREFANAVSQEKWIMEAGKLRKEGQSVEKEDATSENKVINDDVIKDAYGNEIKVEKQKELSSSEKKSKIKKLQKQIKDGKKNNTLTEDEIFEIEDEIEKLKE